jgi:hypothetical protein
VSSFKASFAGPATAPTHVYLEADFTGGSFGHDNEFLDVGPGSPSGTTRSAPIVITAASSSA